MLRRCAVPGSGGTSVCIGSQAVMPKRKSDEVLPNDRPGLGEAQPFKAPAAEEQVPRLREISEPAPLAFFQLFEAGDHSSPGVTDAQSLHVWKHRVRFWCLAYLKPNDCSAFVRCRGAVPGNPDLRCGAARCGAAVCCVRSEQFLGWCAAYWLEPVRGRWWTWSLEKRGAALTAARTLVDLRQMELARDQIRAALA